MRNKFKYVLFFLTTLIIACNTKPKTDETIRQSVSIFSKGNEINSKNFTGKAWLQMMVESDSTLFTKVGNVTFEPKARTNWHTHPGGQILIVTNGEGYYQEKNKPAQFLQEGDSVKIPPHTEHWHGAAPHSGFTHIAINMNLDAGDVRWLGPVTDEEYNRIKSN